MGDGMPTISGPPYVRDPERLCFICERKGCMPLNHVDTLLSHDDARRLARVVFDEAGVSTPRAELLARYVLAQTPARQLLARCPAHPRYQVKRPPRAACEGCWRLWIDKNPEA